MVPVWGTQCTHINTYIILVYSMDPGFILLFILLCYVIMDVKFCSQTQLFNICHQRYMFWFGEPSMGITLQKF